MSKNIKKWKVISTKVLLSDPRLQIVEDTIELPNGAQSSYLKHGHAIYDSVITLAVNHKGEVLIQKEYSHPPAKVMWQLPGGSMKNKETPKKAALRELSEESGYSAKKIELLGNYYTHNRLSDQKQYVFLCTELFERKLKQDDDEFIENYWLSVKKIKTMISKHEFENINLLAALNMWFNSNHEKESM